MTIPDATQIAKRMAHERQKEDFYLLALAGAAMNGDKSDEISEYQARKKYGKVWLEDRLQRGLIHFSRVGSGIKSTKYYSVYEIEVQKLTEKGLLPAYEEALQEMQENLWKNQF